MFGIYGKLASSNLYGSNLSWGMVDELGQQFGYDNTQDVSYYLNRYQYTNQQARNIVDAVWSNMYNNISNVNNVLRHINDISAGAQERKMIHGEALGLRGFMHSTSLASTVQTIRAVMQTHLVCLMQQSSI